MCCGIAARCNLINPLMLPIKARDLSRANAYIGRFRYGMRPGRKPKVLRPGGKWVYWNGPIGWDNGSVRLFQADPERPARLPIFERNSGLRNRLFLHVCMRLPWACTSITLTVGE